MIIRLLCHMGRTKGESQPAFNTLILMEIGEMKVQFQVNRKSKRDGFAQ